MSKHFIVDGYNAMHRLSLCEDNNLQAGRERLIALIKKYKLAGSSNNKLTIVFDGKMNIFSPYENVGKGVIFTQDETADDKIKRMVEDSKNPREIVVITDDNEIKYYTRGLGAKVTSIADFFARTKKKSKSTDNEKMSEYDESYFQITDELKKLWLKR
ncbi:MAG: NYN domain-containing protein [bacterium]